jgi:hypothetical protein
MRKITIEHCVKISLDRGIPYAMKVNGWLPSGLRLKVITACHESAMCYGLENLRLTKGEKNE